LLNFKSVRRASKVAYNYWKRKGSDETLNLKLQHFKKRKNKNKNSSTSPWFSDFSLHLRLHPCMAYIRASMVEILPAFHILKGRICSSWHFEIIKGIKSNI
jgi:hypothetical protein